MARPLLAVIAAVGLGLWTSARADGAASLAEAQAALERNDARAAARLAEEALPGAPAGERPGLLDVLRKSYPRAIQEAEAAGSAREAAAFRENASILGVETTTATSASPGVTPVPEAAPAMVPSLEPPRPPLAVQPDATSAEPDPAPVAAPAPGSTPAEPVRPTPEPVEPAAPLDAATPPLGQGEVKDADAAFRAKRYGEAGRIYAELARQNRLPAVRRDPWAYCRMVAVVERINATPGTSQDWKAIQTEILQIRQLSPENWYAEYLRSLVAELSGQGRRPGSDRLVVRASAPEETSRGRRPAVVPANHEARRQAPAPAAAEAGQRVGQPGTAVNNWQVWESPNFRIFHADEALAAKAAQIAEATRQSQQRLWARQEIPGAWEPRCDVYLYPTAAVFSQMTGQPTDSPGFSTMGLNQGQVIARRVNLRADHPNLLGAVLPHEVTHVVLADLFPEMQIPRWADEGLAVLAEPTSEQQLRASDLQTPLAQGQLFPLSDLMTMDYPDGRYWSLYYAQCVSLTRYLVEMGTPGQFITFLQGAQRSGVEAELRRVYQIDGYVDLQKRWFDYARTNASAATTARLAADTATATATEARR